ncbi:MAG: hypothetical protein AB7O67_04285 [Vicinamibacterales bacterium]
MKILFVLGATSRIRNFEQAITILAGRGHTLQLTGRPRKGRFALPRQFSVKGVTARENPTTRSDAWRPYVEGLRGARDYLRYLGPEFDQATRLVRRAYEIAPTGFALFCRNHAWVRRHARRLAGVLAYAERLIPSDPAIEQFVRDENPDLMLVTPLVTFESYQTDYVKAAHRLGIPVGFLPFSWDNLTNKGLMRVHPDRVIVWNEVQRREAVELHGARPDAVAIAGAARFDEFFARVPATSRDAFCAQYGLDPRRPFVLYLGSSQLTGPNEMELVRQWVEATRQSPDAAVRECGLLVRPHPALRASWTTVDFTSLGNVALSLDASRGADQELFDSLYHAHAAVGLNTSAMLEAAIVGRPVLTLLIPGFDEGQVGTIHFRYLVEAFGGLVQPAASFEEHHRQLAPLLAGEPQVSARSRAFAEQFLRPRGIAQPVSPILADEIERVGALRKSPRRFTPPWHPPLRWALRAWLRRQYAHAGGQSAPDTSPVATNMSLRPVRTALEEIRESSGPVFIGPWLDDIRLELLYWIPFVRWAVQTYGIAPDRLTVVSRAGARDWYGALAPRYLDARELFRGREFDEGLSRTVPQSQQNPKQAVMYPFDEDILQRAAAMMDVTDYQSLHPLMFFRVLQRIHSDREPARLLEVLRHERLPAPAAPAATGRVVVATPDESGAGPAALATRVAGGRAIVRLDGTEALEAQAGALAGAHAFVGPYGDLAVLAAAQGTPAYAVLHETLPAEEAGVIAAVCARGTWAPLQLVPVEDAAAFPPREAAEEMR